jgi:hypothetical protein
MRTWLFLLAACSAPAKPGPTTPPAPAAKACASAEHRQFEFWVGDWDVTVRARQSPTSETWGEAKGRQRIESILGGCAIAEHFSAEGPQTPWAGKSYSSWQPAAGKWRQTWVDDQGGYIALTGGVEAGVMTLYGEPRPTPDGKQLQMRMVFLDVTPRWLRWEWQRSEDGWQTSVVMMRIDYVRR